MGKTWLRSIWIRFQLLTLFNSLLIPLWTRGLSTRLKCHSTTGWKRIILTQPVRTRTTSKESRRRSPTRVTSKRGSPGSSHTALSVGTCITKHNRLANKQTSRNRWDRLPLIERHVLWFVVVLSLNPRRDVSKSFHPLCVIETSRLHMTLRDCLLPTKLITRRLTKRDSPRRRWSRNARNES